MPTEWTDERPVEWTVDYGDDDGGGGDGDDDNR